MDCEGPHGMAVDGRGLLQRTGNGEGRREPLAIEVNGEFHDTSLMKILAISLWRIVND